MNRINALFAEKQKGILSVYFTAGFPQKESTGHIITALSQAGADLVEIGIPFSDPLADGPVIQASSQAALKNGMSLNLLFTQLKTIRKQTQLPLILMGYLNPVLQFGMENFLKQAELCGVDGVILPDLPPNEYKKHYQNSFDKHGIKMIFLITPHTGEERIRQIDELSSSFIYMVTSSTTTGKSNSFTNTHHQYFSYISGLGLKNPVLAGFGIYDKTGFEQVCSYVNGAVVGSAFISELSKNQNDAGASVHSFIQKIKS